jgi:hypothetical protein
VVAGTEEGRLPAVAALRDVMRHARCHGPGHAGSVAWAAAEVNFVWCPRNSRKA